MTSAARPCIRPRTAVHAGLGWLTRVDGGSRARAQRQRGSWPWWLSDTARCRGSTLARSPGRPGSWRRKSACTPDRLVPRSARPFWRRRREARNERASRRTARARGDRGGYRGVVAVPAATAPAPGASHAATAQAAATARTGPRHRAGTAAAVGPVGVLPGVRPDPAVADALG